MTDAVSISDHVLAGRLARARDKLEATLAVLETELAAGTLAPELAGQQARVAQGAYDRESALARLAAETGWHTWTGVGGLLYARRPMSSPPRVTRAADVEGLRAGICRGESR